MMDSSPKTTEGTKYLLRNWPIVQFGINLIWSIRKDFYLFDDNSSVFHVFPPPDLQWDSRMYFRIDPGNTHVPSGGGDVSRASAKPSAVLC